VWLDPLRWGRAAAIVADGIATTTGADRAALDANAARFSDEADAAWSDAVEIIATIPEPNRLLVTNHDALEYFADRFGLKVIGTVIPGGSTLAEPSAQDVSELVDALRDSGVRAVFTETTTSPRLITTVARELGSEIVVIELPTDSLGPAGSDTATYADLIRTIAQRIAEGLSS
jgi:zinc/manganese transport system substrate-binding protein